MAPVKLLSLAEQLTPSGGVINTIELGVADRAAVSDEEEERETVAR